MQSALMKVGILAKRTGLTVRTLHYYEEIGLLVPTRRSATGYRLYGVETITRLHQILSLRQFGLSLEDIRACLDQPDVSLYQVIQLHLAHLREQIALQQQLYGRLETIAARLRRAEDISVEELIQTIEAITMSEKYFTPDQQQTLQERARLLGEERIHQAEAEWKELIEQVRAEMAKGTNPSSEDVQALAQRWQNLIEAFTGGHQEIRNSLATMYKEEGPKKASRGMVDAEVMAYMGKAMASSKDA